ncbi:MAG: LamG-like jellyroll fold domain-containing protein, partial [Planctomycetota bacterium]
MSTDKPPRNFDFSPLEDRILLSADGFEAPDEMPNVDLEIVNAMIEELEAEANEQRSNEQRSPTADSQVVVDADTTPNGEAAGPPSIASNESLELIFVDESVADSETLLQGLRENAAEGTRFEIITISSDEDGVATITDALESFRGVDALHLVSHGDGEGIRLGNVRLDADSLSGYAGDLASWRAAMDDGADLLIYGCDLASTSEGQELIDSLAALCDCDVAASDDLTGHESLGGDWILEYQVGDVTTDVAFGFVAQSSWHRTLDITTGLVGHYEFELGNQTVDSAGNQNLIVSSGNASLITDAAVGDTAVEFNVDPGDNGVLEAADNAAQDFGTGDFTVSFWYNQVGSVAGDAHLVGDSYGASQAGFRVYLDSSNNLRFMQSDGVASNSFIVGTAALNGTWNLVTVTRESGTYRAYVNGNLETTSTPTSRNLNTGSALRFGAAGSSTNDYDGGLDDVRLYTRALSESDVSELYFAAADFTSDLVGHYEFETAGAGISADSAGNQNASIPAGGIVVESVAPMGDEAADFSLDSSGNSYFEVVDNNAQDFGSGDFTISTWYQLDSNPSTTVRLLGDYDGASSGFVLLANSSGNLQFIMDDGSASSSSSTSGTFNGSWQHVAVTFDASTNQGQWHFNGVAGNTFSFTGGSIDTANSLLIGASGASNGDFDGSLDDVRLYTRALKSVDIVALFGQGDLGQPAGYSYPGGANNNFEWITNVSFAGINNTTGPETDAYGNYTSEVGAITRGATNTLSVSIVDDGDDDITAWIDWNQDGDFNDAGESFIVATGISASGPFSIDITTPNDAVLGNTIMRVGLEWRDPPSPDGGEYGEFEDYTITVSAAPTGITVDTTGDTVDGTTTDVATLLANRGADGFISLREAILAVNNDSGSGWTIDLGAGTYVLTRTGSGENSASTGDLDITSNITIVGTGADDVIISGAGLGDRIFDIRSGGELTLSGLTLSGASSGGQDGAAIYNDGTLTASDIVIRDNTANNYAAGLASVNSAVATLDRVAFINNDTNNEGGAIRLTGGTVNITNSTFSGNDATNSGGAITVAGASAVVNISHSTFAENTTGNGGGALRRNTGTANISYSIFADNSSTNGGDDVHGAIMSGGYNIIEHNSNFSGSVGTDILGSDPGLSALTDIGNTFVYTITSSSIAFDAATGSSQTVDQTGSARDSNPDIGAYETSAPADITSNLVAHYEFEENGGSTIEDSTINDNDGSTVNSPVWSGDSAVGGFSMDFSQDSGSNAYVSVSDDASIDISADFSVAFWYNSSDSSSGIRQLIGQYSVGDGFFIAKNSSNALQFVVDGDSSIVAHSYAGGWMADGNWHHVVATRSGDDFQLYVNGVGNTASTQTVGTVSTGEPLLIGGTDSSDFEGLLDEVRIYSRALSSADVTALYNNTGASSSTGQLFFTTNGDVSGSGTPGINSWQGAEILEFGGSPTFEPGGTSGTISSVFNLNDYASGDVDTNAIHVVSQDVTVGGFTLLRGDVLFSSAQNATISGISVADEDILVFRPDTPGDLSSGTVSLFLDSSDFGLTGDVQALTLVESDITVGGQALNAGDLIIANDEEDLTLLEVTATGSSSAATTSLFVDSSDLGINTGNRTVGVHLVSADT